MNFYDTLQQMDYQVKEKTDKYILIIKHKRVSDIVIIFDIKEKVISGYLKPNDILKDLEDVSYQYSLFREMQNDLKELSKLSSYDIL